MMGTPNMFYVAVLDVSGLVACVGGRWDAVGRAWRLHIGRVAARRFNSFVAAVTVQVERIVGARGPIKTERVRLHDPGIYQRGVLIFSASERNQPHVCADGRVSLERRFTGRS
eukprot:3242915-Pyramimonas_sp.AAC.1